MSSRDAWPDEVAIDLRIVRRVEKMLSLPENTLKVRHLERSAEPRYLIGLYPEAISASASSTRFLDAPATRSTLDRSGPMIRKTT